MGTPCRILGIGTLEMVTPPPNVQLIPSGEGIRERWRKLGKPPLCPYAEFEVESRPFRITPHFGLLSLNSDTRLWTRVEGADGLLAELRRRKFCSRFSFGVFVDDFRKDSIGRMACSCRDLSADIAATYLGWPKRDGGAKRFKFALKDAVERRSNDFWLCDALSNILYGVDLVTGKTGRYLSRMGLSIVIPCYGAHDTLPLAVKAIANAAEHLGRSFLWECIVVDDCNATPIDYRQLTVKRCRIVRSERRLHCGGARNLGLFEASMPMVMFCDADIIIPKNYLEEHLARHLLSPNLITVSFRERVADVSSTRKRGADFRRDTRFHAVYEKSWVGTVKLATRCEVWPYKETRAFRDFGFGRRVGPADLQFMVKGNNLMLRTSVAKEIRFPDEFVGWGPEDVCFAAGALAEGEFVVPVLTSTVYHIEHSARSGSIGAQKKELKANLRRYNRRLISPWRHGLLF